METCTGGFGVKTGEARLRSSDQTLASRPALLRWITSHELEALGNALSRGCLPPDFQGKLGRLTKGDLSDHFIEQNCRLFAALLAASEAGSFREASSADCERLLRVLAYVRKDDDEIPDYKPDGFADDQREMRAVTVELNGLIQAFKVWRLRNQVPAMWSDPRASARYLQI
jgi:hypothetical protein